MKDGQAGSQTFGCRMPAPRSERAADREPRTAEDTRSRLDQLCRAESRCSAARDLSRDALAWVGISPAGGAEACQAVNREQDGLSERRGVPSFHDSLPDTGGFTIHFVGRFVAASFGRRVSGKRVPMVASPRRLRLDSDGKRFARLFFQPVLVCWALKSTGGR